MRRQWAGLSESGSVQIAWMKPVVIFMLGLSYAVTAQAIFSYDHDTSLYLGLARSISRREGFVFNGAFNEQVPPGLAVLLSPLAPFVSPLNIQVYQYLILAFGVTALFLTWLWASEAKGSLPWLTAIIVGLTPGFFYVSTGVVYAETPFMVASLAVLWWSERATRPESKVRRGFPLLLFALCAIAVPALRTVGIALPVALVLSVTHDTVRRRFGRQSAADWRGAAIFLGSAAAAFVAGWSRVVSANSTGRYPGGFAPSYMAHLRLRSSLEPDLGILSFGEMLMRIPESIVRQAAHLAEALTGIGWVKPFILSPVIVLVAALVIIGLVRALRRDQPLAAWYALVFGGIIALWPFDEGQRFLVPILPILVSFAIDGARTALTYTSSATAGQRRVVASLLLLAGVVSLVLLRPWSQALSKQDLAAIAAWVLLAALWFVLQPRIATVSSRLVMSTLGILWLVAFGAGNGYQIQAVARARLNLRRDDLRLAAVGRAIDWLQTNAPRRAVVMTDFYSPVHLLTGLRSVPLPATGRTEVLTAALVCSQPDFVVVNNRLPNPYVLPDEPTRFQLLRRAGVGEFEQVATYLGGAIYRFSATRRDCPPQGPG